MDTPMSFEEYKQKAIDFCRKTYPAYTEEVEDSLNTQESRWREYMADFSPETAVSGVVSGLI